MHWTYAEFNSDDDLQQGDFLSPSKELRDILDELHPHFNDDKYIGFTIATQSCDLVRRGRSGKAKARYISIATVRSLTEVLPRLLTEITPPVAHGVFLVSKKEEARRFLERLFNQNEQTLGLFYFHPDAEVCLGQSSIAFLRVKIPLRAEHYDVLVRSRKGRLAPEFQAKFGWLVGNLYARVASPDWSDVEGGRSQLQGLIKKYLSEQIANAGPTWIDDEVVDAAREAGVSIEKQSAADLVADLEHYRPKPRIELLVDATLDQVSRVLEPNESERKKLRNRLLNDQHLRRLVKKGQFT